MVSAVVSLSPRFGTTKAMAAEQPSAMTPKLTNTPRQSVTVRTASTGTVPVTAPRPPAAICRPLMNGMRSPENHIT